MKFENIPELMKEKRNWLLEGIEIKVDDKGNEIEIDKIPVLYNWEKNQWTQKQTKYLMTFEQIQKAYNKYKGKIVQTINFQKKGDKWEIRKANVRIEYVAFQFKDSGMAGLDFDKILNEKSCIYPIFMNIMNICNLHNGFGEYSKSGKGMHFYFIDDIDIQAFKRKLVDYDKYFKDESFRVNNDKSGIDYFTSNKHNVFIVTGNTIEGFEKKIISNKSFEKISNRFNQIDEQKRKELIEEMKEENKKNRGKITSKVRANMLQGETEFKYINRVVSIYDVIKYYTGQDMAHRNSYPCPFHQQGKYTKNFYIDYNYNRWRCIDSKCRAGSERPQSVLDFVILYTGKSARDSAIELDSLFSLGLYN